MNNKSKTNKGITLIALIITVIVLLILAGTAISIAVNGESLFGKANDAKTSWNSKVSQEETTINQNLALLDQLLPSTPAGLTIPTGIEPGDTVTWTPSGTYEWNKDYYSDDDTVTKMLYAGTAATTATATTSTNWSDSTTAINMTISSWKVLSVDAANNVVKLVPSAPTASGVKLRGAQGYNNSVKLLNDACDALYGGTAGDADGITARSISMIDIEGALTTTQAVTTAKANYGTRPSSAYTVANSKYPLIYGEEALRKINGIETTTGIGMSEEATTGLDANGFIPRVNGARNTVENATIQPAHTNYYLANSDFATALGYPASGYTGTNGPFLPNGSSTRNYWVASRCVYADGSMCCFNVRGMNVGNLDYYYMFDSNDDTWDDELSLFPVVTLSSGVLSEVDNAYTYTPAT